jgi:hypothetical protein
VGVCTRSRGPCAWRVTLHPPTDLHRPRAPSPNPNWFLSLMPSIHSNTTAFTMSVTRSMDDQLSVLSLSTGQPASLSSLPPELILRILELTVEDDTTLNFAKHRRALTCASLVAKKWSPLAKLLLLSKIYLDDRRASGPVLEGLLAAFGDKRTAVCRRIVLQGPESNQNCFELFSRPRAIHELVLLGCTFPEGIADFLRAKGLEGKSSAFDTPHQARSDCLILISFLLLRFAPAESVQLQLVSHG